MPTSKSQGHLYVYFTLNKFKSLNITLWCDALPLTIFELLSTFCPSSHSLCTIFRSQNVQHQLQFFFNIESLALGVYCMIIQNLNKIIWQISLLLGNTWGDFLRQGKVEWKMNKFMHPNLMWTSQSQVWDKDQRGFDFFNVCHLVERERQRVRTRVWFCTYDYD